MALILDPMLEIALVIIISVALALLAWKLKLLTVNGSAAAFAVGVVTGALGSLTWLLLLIVFTIIGFGATVFGLSKKKEKGLQEGDHGERDYKNVIGVAIPCCIFAIANFVTGGQYEYYMMVGYVATIAVAAADTAASELGIRDPKVWMITTLKRVEPGVDGGVSVMGSLISLIASAVVTVIGWLVINQTLSDINILIVILAGFIGCVLDSLVGATLETKGYISKYGNNCITGIAGALIAIALVYLI